MNAMEKLLRDGIRVKGENSPEIRLEVYRAAELAIEKSPTNQIPTLRKTLAEAIAAIEEEPALLSRADHFKPQRPADIEERSPDFLPEMVGDGPGGEEAFYEDFQNAVFAEQRDVNVKARLTGKLFVLAAIVLALLLLAGLIVFFVL